MPGWLSLSPSGVLTGTPSSSDQAAGPDSFAVTVTDADGASTGPQTLTINLDPTLAFYPGTAPYGLADATAGGRYYQSYISTVGGTQPITFSSTDLPGWLTLTPQGQLSGTPTAADVGLNTFGVTATDADGVSTGPQVHTIRVDPAPTIDATALPDGIQGNDYDQFLSASGGTGNLRWSSAALPDWLTLSPAGELEGVPANRGPVSIPVTVTDQNGATTTQVLELDVDPAQASVDLQVAPDAVAYGQENTVAFTAIVTGGLIQPVPTGQVTFSDTDGPLCTATLDAGVASCSPTVEQIPPGIDSSIIATYAGDSSYGASASDAQTLDVSPGVDTPAAITSADATTFFTGAPALFAVTTSGFPLPTLTETGSLPAGVSFTDNGDGTATISGNPSPASNGTYDITITASSPSGPDVVADLALTVATPLAITSPDDATFTLGQPGAFLVTSVGQTASTQFALDRDTTETGLPFWATFTDNHDGTATISGTPPLASAGEFAPFTELGTFTFTLSAYDGFSDPVSQTFTLTAQGAPVFTNSNTAAFTTGSDATLNVFSEAYPEPTMTTVGTVPAGMTFTDRGRGVGVLHVSPDVAAGTYHVTIQSTNDLGTATEIYTVYIGGQPAFTSAGAATIDPSTGGTFTVVTQGTPVASLSESGTLPAGVTFTDQGDGTATLAVAPGAPVGTTDLTFTATNPIQPNHQSFVLTLSSLPAQTITFSSTAPTDAVVAGPAYTPVATSTSGLPVTFSISPLSTGSCHLGSAGALTFAFPGSCYLEADQPGNAQYAPADEVQQIIDIGEGTAPVTFTTAAPSDATVNATPYRVRVSGAPTQSDIVVTVDPASTSVCVYDGDQVQVTFIGAGTCTLDASQAEGQGYTATSAKQSFQVGPGVQTITVNSTPDDPRAGGQYVVTGFVSPSNLPFVVSIDPASASVCSSDGAYTVTFLAVGTCTMDIDQPGDADYLAAPQVQQVATVGQGQQDITIYSAPPDDASVGGPFYGPGAFGGPSTSPVTVSADPASASVCTAADWVVNFIGVGTCTLDFDQAGDANYLPAPEQQQSFQVGQGTQTISFTSTAPTGAVVGGSAYAPAASSTSGLAVDFSIDPSSGSVCSLSGGSVTFQAAGTCTVDADQVGDGDYLVAPTASQSFTVARAPQSVSFVSAAPTGAVVGGATYLPTATSSSGLPVTFSIDPASSGVCVISAGSVSFTHAGTCTVDADQAGDGDYLAAPQAQQSFSVAAIPTIVPNQTSMFPSPSGTAVASLPVTLSAPSSSPVTAHWTTIVVTGTTAPTTDYLAASGTVTFQPGQTSATVPITIVANHSGAPENVIVSFTNPTNAYMGGFWGLGLVVIQPIPTIVPNQTSIFPSPNGTAVASLPVSLSAPSSSPVTAHWTTIVVTGTTAPTTDYLAASGTVTFQPGQTSATVPITILANHSGAPENVIVSFTNPTNAYMGGFWGLGLVVIQPIPTIVPNQTSIFPSPNGTAVASLPVSLSAPSSSPVTAHWTTIVVTGTTAPTTDYLAASGTVTFQPGQTSATVPITIVANHSGAPENVIVSFTNPTNAYMGGFWGLGLVVIQPPPPH